MTVVESITLRQGAWYALEQAGRLLVAASVLSEGGDWSTAVVLAMFGREEIGRSKILRDLAKQVDSGRSLKPSDVREACEDHVRKQAAGNLSTSIRSEAPSMLESAARAIFVEEPGTAKWREAEQVGKQAAAAKRRSDPEARHLARMANLYVDLEDNAEWRRPIRVSQREAHSLVVDATNDYACERDRLETFATDHPEMSTARATLGPEFELPSPKRPQWAG